MFESEVIIVSKSEINEIVDNTISRYHEECSKLPKDLDFTDKMLQHEELIIKTILETLLKNQ